MKEDILLQVKDLKASVEGKEILKGVNLTVRPGEVHAIMAVSYTHLAGFIYLLLRASSQRRRARVVDYTRLSALCIKKAASQALLNS